MKIQKKLNEYMDFSDYPKSYPKYDAKHKKKIGYFKDEMNGQIITEFIGLRPKMYSFKIDLDYKTKLEYTKSNGVPKKL